ncbi:MAG: sucrose synthase, partial [Spirochaetota bacterium]|nr:sucrose synthase [Spirochaetota bacterium]
MFQNFITFIQDHRQDVYLLLRHYILLDRTFLLWSDLWDQFKLFCEQDAMSHLCEENELKKLIYYCQEATVSSPWIYFGVRYRIARWNYIRIHTETLALEEINESEYLAFKERQVDGKPDQWTLEIDLGPFERDFPKLKESRSIGQGVEFLNRHLSSKLFQEIGKEEKDLLEFLRLHQYQGRQLMLSHRIQTFDELRAALRNAEDYLKALDPSMEWSLVEAQLETQGFLPGWGRTVDRVRETMSLLSDILEAPSPVALERFLSRIPMIFNLVALSPHGYFGQDNVLGLPDTGGQVIYI